jgi:hypothetical protein
MTGTDVMIRLALPLHSGHLALLSSVKLFFSSNR